MSLPRRSFTRWLTVLGAATAASGHAADAARATGHGTGPDTKESADAHHTEAMQRHSELLKGDKLTIGMLVYPGMFLQDLVGPLTVFEALMNRDIHLLWKDTSPVGNESPGPQALIPVTPTTAFKDCPERLDVLFVPGGVPGTLTMMEDPEVLGFLQRHGTTARYVTSVCTGSLVLGAAGLLKGYRAASHWAILDVLSDVGATPVADRIVIDRNRITGGGVTAGIDFGLHLVALLRSPLYAQAVQLYLEYDPLPPFNAGSPKTAPAAARDFIDDMFEGLRRTTRATARRAMERLS